MPMIQRMVLSRTSLRALPPTKSAMSGTSRPKSESQNPLTSPTLIGIARASSPKLRKSGSKIRRSETNQTPIQLLLERVAKADVTTVDILGSGVVRSGDRIRDH